MQIITLSGWAQAYDFLGCISPDAKHIEYGSLANTEELFDRLSGLKCDKIIGWSLGGQLAVRAIAQGVIKPSALELWGVPYQFVQSDAIKDAMPKLLFESFAAGYKISPAKTLKQFSLLAVKGGANSKEQARILQENISDDKKNWIYWLNELGHFSCDDIDFGDFPQTNIYHGRNDAVVSYKQAYLFKEKIKNSSVNIIDGLGHVPAKAVAD